MNKIDEIKKTCKTCGFDPDFTAYDEDGNGYTICLHCGTEKDMDVKICETCGFHWKGNQECPSCAEVTDIDVKEIEKPLIQRLHEDFKSNKTIRPYIEATRTKLIKDQCYSMYIHILKTAEELAERVSSLEEELVEKEAEVERLRERYKAMKRQSDDRLLQFVKCGAKLTKAEEALNQIK